MPIDENIHWTQDTMPSQILKEIYDLECKSESSTINNRYAIAFALGKAIAMETLLEPTLKHVKK